MNVRHKLLLPLTSLIFVLFVVLFFSTAKLLNSDAVKERIHVYISEKTGVGITYRNSEYHLFPFPEIIFNQVNVSIPNKAEGSVASLSVHPDILALIRGKVGIAKVRLETPHFTLKISEDTEKPSLQQIEEKIHSVIDYIVSTTPELSVDIHNGKLDFKSEDKIAFSFDLIQSRISASRRAVGIELKSRSNMWDDFSISSSIKADDLKSEGTIRLTHLHPDILMAGLLKVTAGALSVANADMLVKFETLGLRMVKASMESSLSGLKAVRRGKSLKIGDAVIKGNLEIEPDAVSIVIKQAKLSQPALNLSGQYIFNRRSETITVTLDGESIFVASVRQPALTLLGDIPLVRTIFTIVQGGEVPIIRLHTTGKSLNELGRTENIQIAGRMRAGTIYIEAKDLWLQNVAGEVLISHGVLDGNNVEASLGGTRCSEGEIIIGLEGENAPLHIDTRVKIDAGQLPSLLKDKNLLKNEAVLHEMDRIHDLQGGAKGRLILGDRLDSIHVKIAIEDVNIMARYDPLPFTLALEGGQFYFDEKTVGLINLRGSIGGSSFSGLSARLVLSEPYDLEITGGQLSIIADEIYPWITSFPGILPALKDVRSVKGVLFVSSMDLLGPLYQSKEWKFHVTGETKKLGIDAVFIQGKLEEMSGMFALTNEELSLKDMHMKIIDSLITVTGSVREFPSDIKSVGLSLKGMIGPEVTQWVGSLLKLPPEIKIRAPFSVKDAVIFIEKDRKTAFTGSLLFGQGTLLSLNVTKTPDETTIRDLTVTDQGNEFHANILLTEKILDVSFRGRLFSQTLKSIFADSIYSNASLQGDFKTHIVIEHPRQSNAEGRLEGEYIPVPWNSDMPLVVGHVALEAKEQGVFIDASEFTVGGMTFTAKGTLSSLPDWFAVDLDITSNGIDSEMLGKILRNRGRESKVQKARLLKDIPIRGTLKLQSDFFRYGHFIWEPFYANGSFDGKTLLITVNKASLCGVSTVGTIGIKDQGLKIDVALSAKELAFQPTVLCFTETSDNLTGTFQMEARLKSEGNISEIVDKLEGTFTILAKDGKILKSKALDKTFDLLNKSKNFKEQFPHLDREIISYNKLKISGFIKKHKIQLDEGMLDSSVIGIVVSGYLDINSDYLDLNAFVSPLKTVSWVVRRIPILGYVLGDHLISIPVKISGNVKDPQITFLSPSAIGSEAAGIIERFFKLPIMLVTPIFPAENEK